MYFTCCKKPQNGHRPISGVPRGSEQGRDEQGQKVQDFFHRWGGGGISHRWGVWPGYRSSGTEVVTSDSGQPG